MATGSGTATFSTQTPFFGTIWEAHDIIIELIDDEDGDDTTFDVNVDMLFDWGTNLDTSVHVDAEIQINEDGTATFTTVDEDADGITGSPIDNGLFVGFNAAFIFENDTDSSFTAPADIL
jgi:hypothetical protein